MNFMTIKIPRQCHRIHFSESGRLSQVIGLTRLPPKICLTRPPASSQLYKGQVTCQPTVRFFASTSEPCPMQRRIGNSFLFFSGIMHLLQPEQALGVTTC